MNSNLRRRFALAVAILSLALGAAVFSATPGLAEVDFGDHNIGDQP